MKMFGVFILFSVIWCIAAGPPTRGALEQSAGQALNYMDLDDTDIPDFQVVNRELILPDIEYNGKRQNSGHHFASNFQTTLEVTRAIKLAQELVEALTTTTPMTNSKTLRIVFDLLKHLQSILSKLESRRSARGVFGRLVGVAKSAKDMAKKIVAKVKTPKREPQFASDFANELNSLLPEGDNDPAYYARREFDADDIMLPWETDQSIPTHQPHFMRRQNSLLQNIDVPKIVDALKKNFGNIDILRLADQLPQGKTRPATHPNSLFNSMYLY